MLHDSYTLPFDFVGLIWLHSPHVQASHEVHTRLGSSVVFDLTCKWQYKAPEGGQRACQRLWLSLSQTCLGAGHKHHHTDACRVRFGHAPECRCLVITTLH